MRQFFLGAIVILGIAGPICANAQVPAPVRYALVIGNNHGNAPSDLALPDLEHVE